ncbi:MAG: helix-turn-helix domain-containing protein [Nitrospirota bacterium]|nr:helix-turn-helix domain-containing protein [Nitrospirota bacterium]MDH5585800.1 helix-turn-helix domain-containing protein [Nitrospirota bacterium]MDH5774096.1 helix-turn-helix domain-containing protein [Nitrospirota bacterium]
MTPLYRIKNGAVQRNLGEEPTVDLVKTVGYDRLMKQGLYLQQWCRYRQVSLAQISVQTGIEVASLQSIHNGSLDPSLSLLETIAHALTIPTSWLHHDPEVIQKLWNDADEDEPELPKAHGVDPMFERMIQVRHEHPELFVLLTKLVHHGDPKLIRAAQVNLQSLSKQIRATTLPWGTRPPGHFEPPSD